jgi:hypothetical protein
MWVGVGRDGGGGGSGQSSSGESSVIECTFQAKLRCTELKQIHYVHIHGVDAKWTQSCENVFTDFLRAVKTFSQIFTEP